MRSEWFDPVLSPIRRQARIKSFRPHFPLIQAHPNIVQRYYRNGMMFKWSNDCRMTGIWKFKFFSSPKNPFIPPPFGHLYIILKCQGWHGMEFTMERYDSGVILVNCTPFWQSRMMEKWPNEEEWRGIFFPRQNPYFWNYHHSTIISSFDFNLPCVTWSFLPFKDHSSFLCRLWNEYGMMLDEVWMI